MNRSATLGTLVLAATLAGGAAQAATIAADKLPELPVALPPAGPAATYLAAVHNQIHKRFTDNFLRLIGEKLEITNPLNAPMLEAEVDLTLGGDGQLLGSQITKPSGFPGFDDAIIEIIRDAVPYPRAPMDVRSDDGTVHLHWIFARDQRRDSGLTVRKTFDPIATALPRLLQAGRRDEALNRITYSRSSGEHVGEQFTMLALDWVKASLHQPFATVRMAKLLAARGDADAVKWLKAALRRPDMAAQAGEALTALRIPVCPLVKDMLEGANPNDWGNAAVALATAGDPACMSGLNKLLDNNKAAPDVRGAAATALGAIDDPSIPRTLKATVEAATKPEIKSAALLAQVKQGSGKAKVFLVEPYLRDPSPLMRAAATAGIVRAGGDANLADLYVLFKESDPRPALAALRELEHLQTEASTQLITRLMHRPQIDVQRLAADILVKRGREAASALKLFLDPNADPTMRGRALVVADDAQLQAAASDPRMGMWAYRAMLFRGQPDQAADWFIAHGSKLSPAEAADAMTDWVTYAPAMRVNVQAVATTAQKP